jgi:adenosine deaminase
MCYPAGSALRFFNNTITAELQISHQFHTTRGFKTEARQEAMKACLQKKKAEIDANLEEMGLSRSGEGLVRKDGSQQGNRR